MPRPPRGFSHREAMHLEDPPDGMRRRERKPREHSAVQPPSTKTTTTTPRGTLRAPLSLATARSGSFR